MVNQVEMLTVPTSSNSQSCVHVVSWMQRPIINDLRVALSATELSSIHKQGHLNSRWSLISHSIINDISFQCIYAMLFIRWGSWHWWRNDANHRHKLRQASISIRLAWTCSSSCWWNPDEWATRGDNCGQTASNGGDSWLEKMYIALQHNWTVQSTELIIV